MKNLILNVKNSVLTSLIEMVFKNYDGINILTSFESEAPKAEGEVIFLTDYYDSGISDLLKSGRVDQIIYIGNNVHKGIVCLNPDNCVHLLKDYLLSEDMSYVESEFEPIKVELFYDMEEAPVDLFIKLTGKDGDRYVKRFSSKETFDGVSFDTYYKKGVTHLFYKSDFKSEVNKYLIESYMSDKFKDPNLANVGAGLRGAKSVLREFGVSIESKKMVEQVSDRMLNAVKNHKNLDIQDMLSQKSDRYLKKSFITSFLVSRVIRVFEWASADQLQALTDLSVICDIFLEEEMLLVNTNEEAAESKFNDKEKDIIMTHAQKAYELITSSKTFSPTLAGLVREHHGEKTGIGFCTELNANTAPLITIYRICEDFAIELIRSYEERSFNTIKIYEKLKAKHHKLKHKDIVGKAFQAILEMTKDMTYEEAS